MLGSFTPTAYDMGALLRLGIPIAAIQVGLRVMDVVATIHVGHVSADELAGAALGNLYVYGLFGFGLGTLWAVDPIVSQAFGARDAVGAALGVQRGLVLAVLLSALLMLACIPAEWVLRLLRQPPEVLPIAARYAHLSSPSLLALLTFVTLRQGLQAMKRTKAIVGAILVGNVVNLVLQELFVTGRWGVPAGGANGSALALTAARFAMLGSLFVFARQELGALIDPWRREAYARAPLLATFRLGLPMGAQNSIEFFTFAIISILAGWFGAAAIGGHQVAINIASLLFMVPLGVGNAASVLVGRAIGEGDLPHARRVAASAILCGAAFMAVSAGVLLLFTSPLASTWTSVPEVVVVAATLIPIAGVFQVFDGIQVVSAGVLRGAADTRAALLANLAGFWFVGLPVSLWLGFGAKLGVQGLWWGFVAGLGAVAWFLLVRVRRVLSGRVERVMVESRAV